MSTAATSFVTEVSRKERLEVLFDEVAERTGQRNAIDGRLGRVPSPRWWFGRPK